MNFLKKVFILLFVVILLISVVSCENNDKTENSIEETVDFNNKYDKDNTEDIQSDLELPEGATSIDEDESTIYTVYGFNPDINQTKKSGPFEVTLESALVMRMDPKEDHLERFKDEFDGKESVTMVSLYIEVENLEDETYFIAPNQGVLVTNTKEQVDAELSASDNVGGDFIGQVIKEGQIIFYLDSDAKDITEITYVAGKAHVDDAEEIVFKISF